MRLPHKANQPVETKTNNQISIEIITGIGKSSILNGRCFVPNLFLNKETPMPCAMNCMRILIARIEEMTWLSFMNKLKIKPRAHKKISETYGKFFVGCSFENILKKFPSTAAAYGTLE